MTRSHRAAIFSGLLLIATSLLALGLLAVSDFNVGWLKEWQVLAASVIALGAAGLSYSAAMAKVWSDRDAASRGAARVKQNIFLRLRACLEILIDDADTFKSQLAQKRGIEPVVVSKVNTVSTVLESNYPPELEEAWKRLDIFTPEAATALALLRRGLREFNRSIVNSGQLASLNIPKDVIAQRTDAATPALKAVIQSANVVLAELNKAEHR